MDLSVLFTKAADVGLTAVALLTACYLLVKRQDRMENARDKKEELANVERTTREQQQRTDCKAEVASLVDDIRSLQDSRYNDSKTIIGQCMGVLKQNAESFKRLVDLEERRTDTYTIKKDV